MAPLCFAYYCSGHGYGHATRVSAFACHLLRIPGDKPTVYICSSAPKRVFSDSIELGAIYRHAEIDPIIVQPLAYHVDRQKSVEVLRSFLDQKDTILDRERQWLREINARAVLSDAAFLGCLAARAAGIPSILITNFTFDSVYSYLSTPLLDTSPPQSDQLALVPDIPVALNELEPLVEQIIAGYRCADILFLLPGHIPIPSFSVYPSLPAENWVDVSSNQLHPTIIDFLSQAPSSYEVFPSTPFPVPSRLSAMGSSRSVIQAPLLVRFPTPHPSVYSPEGRSRFLSSIGVPVEFHDPHQTKILIVSFGGQVFRAPSRSGSRTQSRGATPIPSPVSPNPHNIGPEMDLPPSFERSSFLHTDRFYGAGQLHAMNSLQVALPYLVGVSRLWIPGAPPASQPATSYPEFSAPKLATTPSSPDLITTCYDLSPESEIEPDARLLPDSSWIAIVCGTSKDQWLTPGDDNDPGLPDGFFVAPRDIYMPDLTAIADVLLGKLGYGTVSECVDSCTPFVYVSRPLFIEEHGLRLLLGREGVGVELSRQSYENGDWAAAVEEAWARGKTRKAAKRIETTAGVGIDNRKTEGSNMARKVVSWTRGWWSDHDHNR